MSRRNRSKRVEKLELEENTAKNNSDAPSNLQELYEDEEAMKGLDKMYGTKQEQEQLMAAHRQSLKEHGLNANHHNETKYYE